MTKKKFAELELSLLHLQQNVEIPETHLIIHPVIQRAVEQVSRLSTLLLFTQRILLFRLKRVVSALIYLIFLPNSLMTPHSSTHFTRTSTRGSNPSKQ